MNEMEPGMKRIGSGAGSRRAQAGFTLIELMIVVVIIGILSALAVYGVEKYRAQAKTAEPRQLLGRIAKDQLAAFEAERQESTVLSFGGTAESARSLCPDASGRPLGIGTAQSPVAIPAIQSSKWQPSPSDFRDEGWSCLGFSVSTPLYFGYGMDATQAGTSAAPGDEFTAFAIGDLDGDTQPSTMELQGIVRGSASGDLALVLATAMRESAEL